MYRYGAFDHSFGTKDGDKPHIVTSLYQGVDKFIMTPSGQQPPKLGNKNKTYNLYISFLFFFFFSPFFENRTFFDKDKCFFFFFFICEGEELPETAEERKRRRSSTINMIMDPTVIYSISYHTMYIELLEWQGMCCVLQ